MWKWPAMNSSAYNGDSARRICGWAMMPRTPSTPITTNHSIITGPKNFPTVAVPRRCTANSPMRITAVIGTTKSANLGSTTFIPSTADSTEIAGVIMLSPKNRAAPRIPRVDSAEITRGLDRPPSRRTRVINAITPPSPSLSARITSTT